jgi:hypothetical protein
MTAVAPRPVCRLIVEVGRPTVDGATIVHSECCGMVLTHEADSLSDDDAFDLSGFWNDEGPRVTACRCGNPLPDAKGWTP